MTDMIRERDWQIRHFVYRELARTGAVPSHDAIAAAFGISTDEARRSLRRLHAGHALFLRDGADEILMANPFSAIATDYEATVDGKRYYANCAWDSLGIAAALGCDAEMVARHPLDGEAMRHAIVDGDLVGETDAVVHFAKPFRNWYDDLADT